MTELQRWTLAPAVTLGVKPELVHHPQGDYIEFCEHRSRIAEKDAEIERLHEYLNDLTNKWSGCVERNEFLKEGALKEIRQMSEVGLNDGPFLAGWESFRDELWFRMTGKHYDEQEQASD